MFKEEIQYGFWLYIEFQLFKVESPQNTFHELD